MLIYLIQGISYGFAAAVQPGPFQTFIISQTLKNGWRHTLPAALSPLISDGPIIALMLLILKQVPDSLRHVLYIAGGLFILYLAWSTFLAWRSFNVDAQIIVQPNQMSLFKAVLMNMLSPGPYMFWGLVTGPILLRGWSESPTHGIGFLAGFYGVLVTGLAGIILLFGTARQLGPRVNRTMLGISSLALAGFGLYQLWLGFSG